MKKLESGEQNEAKKMGRKWKIITGMCLILLLFCAWIPREQVRADANASLSILEIDYEKETMTIQSTATPADTKLFYSDGKQKTWECAYGKFEENTLSDGTKRTEYVLDISWVSKTKDYTLSLKGDASEKVIQVVLPKQQTNFKVAFDYVKEEFTYTNFDTTKKLKIYWRKNNSTVWNEAGDEMLSWMKYFYSKGAALYFRIGQVRGSSATSPGLRPSKEVKLTVAKEPAAPGVTFVSSSGTITLSGTGVQYKVKNDPTATWKTADSKKLEISTVASDAYFKKDASENPNPSTKDVTLLFRIAPTAKKPASPEKEIIIKAQESKPENAKILIAKADALSLQIVEVKKESGEVTWEAASSANPYEYTIVAAGGTLTSSAKWTAITKNMPILIDNKKAPKDSKIYVRKQAHVLNKTEFYPESEEDVYQVGIYTRDPSYANLNGNPTGNVYAYPDLTMAGDKTKVVIRLVKEEGTWNEKENAGASGGTTTSADAAAVNESGAAAGESGTTTATQNPLTFLICPGGLDIPGASGEDKDKFMIPDVTSIECGGKPLKFSQDPTNEKNILVTITSTEEYEKAISRRNEDAAVTITLSNGEVLNNCVTLNILGKAYLPKETILQVIEDAPTSTARHEFKIVPKKTLKNDRPREFGTTEIQSITVKVSDNESVQIMKDAADVDNVSTAETSTAGVVINKSEDGIWTVSMSAAKLQRLFQGKITSDQKYNAEIEMSDGQKITGLQFCFTKEATVVEGATGGFTMRLSTLEDNIKFKLSYKTPGIWVSKVELWHKDVPTPQGKSSYVEWEIIDVMGNCQWDSNYIYISLDKKIINGLKAYVESTGNTGSTGGTGDTGSTGGTGDTGSTGGTGGTGSTETVQDKVVKTGNDNAYRVVITLSNGAVVHTNYMIAFLAN